MRPPSPHAGRFRIRQASGGDLVDAARVKALAWRQTYPFPDAVFARQDELVASSAELWADRMDRGSYFWVVTDTAEPGAPIVGVAHATAEVPVPSPASLELSMIYLLDIAKGSGIADRLLQMAIGDAPAFCWVLEGNERAVAFCRRHGFEADGAVQQLDGLLAHHRELRLLRR